MEYDIIEQVAELATADERLEEKLSGFVRLLSDFFLFDQCCIYLLDEEGRRFSLKASHGEESGRVDFYGEGKGLPGMVLKIKGPVYALKPAPETSWEGIEDKGLKGFKNVCVHPLQSRSAFYGVIYLKSIRKTTPLHHKKRHLLDLISLQIVMSLKIAELTRFRELAGDELKEAQGRLLNAEKLVALGDMAATIAHEIRNPLISIGGFALRLKKKIGPDSPGIPYVDRMLHEIGRIEKVMNGMVRFLKDSSVELRPDDINDILNEALRIFEEEFRSHGITVIKDLYESRLPVLADREQLKIAFDNLIANAIQSMEKGGTLTFHTEKSGNTVLAKVSDTGGGIDPKILGFIFNPFFTTKKQGTGLGLPITNSIVLMHKGALEVENKEGVGVTFSVKLPSAA